MVEHRAHRPGVLEEEVLEEEVLEDEVLEEEVLEDEVLEEEVGEVLNDFSLGNRQNFSISLPKIWET